MAAVAVARADDDARIEAFLRWFERDAGATATNVTVAKFAPPMGLGIQASGTVREGSDILRVPLDAVMCRDTVLGHPSVSGARQMLAGRRSDEDVLVAFLLVQRALGASSPWAPYLAVLPEVVPSLLAWTAEELAAAAVTFPALGHGGASRQRGAAELAAGFVGEAVAQSLKALADAAADDDTDDATALKRLHGSRAAMGSAAAAALSGPSPPVTAAAVAWAQSVVESRALTLRGRKFLVPFADMANHQQHPEPRVQSDGEHFARHHLLTAGSFLVKADRRAAPGSAVHEDYGDGSNALYLAHHGMVIGENPFDCAAVPLRPVDASVDAAPAAKTAVLAALGIRNAPDVCVRPAAPRASLVPPEALAFLRVRSQPSHAVGKGTACGRTVEAVDDGGRPDRADVSECLGGSVTTSTPDDLRRFTKAVSRQQEAVASLRTSLGPRLEAGPPGSHLALLDQYAREQSRLLEQLLTRLAAIAPKRGPKAKRRAARAAAARRKEDAELAGKLARFNAWFKEAGAEPNMVEARLDPVFRVGVFATGAVAEEEVYLGVPTSVIIGPSDALASESVGPALRRLRETYPRGDEFHELLMLLVVEARHVGNASRWWPYLDLLPGPDETTFPVFWSDDDLLVLRGLPVLDDVTRYRAEVASKYRAVSRAVFDSPDYAALLPPGAFTPEAYRWAHAVLDSRSIWWGGQRHLVPMLDLINCAEGPNPSRVHSTDLDPTGALALTRADRRYARGDQIFENYGQPNHIYFAYHGFSLAGTNAAASFPGRPVAANTHDCAHVAYSIPMPPSPALAEALSAALRPVGRRAGANTSVCITVAGGAVDWSGADSRRAVALVARVNKTLSPKHMTSATAETNAKAELAELVRRQLAALVAVASASEDEATLGRAAAGPAQLLKATGAKDAVSAARRAAGITYRLTQKLLLRQAALDMGGKAGGGAAGATDFAEQAYEAARQEEL